MEEPKQLKRCLSLWEIVIYGVGLILGAGIYVLIGAASGIAGNMIWLSFLIAAMVAGFTAMSYAELSTMYPTSGAEFVYAKEAFGSNLIAWIIGFCSIVVSFSVAATVSVGFAQYMIIFVPAHPLIIAAGLILLMSLVSFWGIKQSARFNIIATSIEVLGLALIIFIGGFQILSGTLSVADLTLFPDHSEMGKTITIMSAASLIFFAYMGFEDIANIAEEAENPTTVLPKAFMLALLISTLIYILVAVVCVSVIPYAELASSDQPLSLVMEQLIGGSAPTLIALIALFATANTVLITLIVGARMIYGMARANALPASVSKIHKKRQTPWVGVVLMGLLSILILAFKKIEVLASIANVGIFILFISVNMSNVVLRFRKPELARPWKSPFNIGKFPILSAFGVLTCFAMLVTLNEPVEIFGYHVSSMFIGLTIFAVSIPLYYMLQPKKIW